ncbi:unnamed protein product, partial [Allacma fusca]
PITMKWPICWRVSQLKYFVPKGSCNFDWKLTLSFVRCKIECRANAACGGNGGRLNMLSPTVP